MSGIRAVKSSDLFLLGITKVAPCVSTFHDMRLTVTFWLTCIVRVGATHNKSAYWQIAFPTSFLLPIHALHPRATLLLPHATFPTLRA
jgi:hypothetical protein